jgi:hypothetical protein
MASETSHTPLEGKKIRVSIGVPLSGRGAGLGREMAQAIQIAVDGKRSTNCAIVGSGSRVPYVNAHNIAPYYHNQTEEILVRREHVLPRTGDHGQCGGSGHD